MTLIKYIFISVFVLLSFQMRADHIIGGDVTYEVVSVDLINMRFVIDIKIKLYRDLYQDGDARLVNLDNTIELGIFENNSGSWDYLRTERIGVDIPNDILLNIPESNCFNIERPETVAADRSSYTIEGLRLDILDTDYRFTYQRCCKTESIINIVAPGEVGTSFEFTLTPAQQRVVNASPVFDLDPANIMCSVYPQDLNFSAMDAEGDRLEYQFCEIISAGGTKNMFAEDDCEGSFPNPEFCGPNEFRIADFIEPTYSFDRPIPGIIPFTIDPASGIISGEGAMPGVYTFAICVSEFRNNPTTGIEEKIGEIKRDYLINVVNCPPIQAAPAGISAKNPGITQVEAREECTDSTFIKRPFDSCGEVEVRLRNFTDADEDDVTYRWEVDLNNGIPPMIITDEWEPRVTFPGEGAYVIMLTINPGEACETFCSQNIVISESFDVDFDVTDQAVCEDRPIIITNTSIGSNAFDFNWDFGDGDTSAVRDPMEVNYTAAGEYDIMLTMTRDVCRDSLTKSVRYFPLPDDIEAVPDKDGGCDSTLIMFDNLSLMDPHPFELTWDFDDGGTSSETSPSHLYTDPGTYIVSVNVKATDDCQEDYMLDGDIIILDGPDARFTADPNPVTNPRDQVTLTNLSDVDSNTSFEWDFGDESPTSMQANESHVYDAVGLFDISLIATSAINNCIDTAVVTVIVSASGDPIFPNAFKPFDGNNDIFKPYSEFNSFISYDLTVWDRWGQRIFQSSELDIGWDGTKNNAGSSLPGGVYIWKVSYEVSVGLDVESREQAGTVLMIR